MGENSLAQLILACVVAGAIGGVLTGLGQILLVNVRYARRQRQAEKAARSESVMVKSASDWVRTTARLVGDSWEADCEGTVCLLLPDRSAKGKSYMREWMPMGPLLKAYCGEESAADRRARLERENSPLARQELWPEPGTPRTALSVTATPTAALSATLSALHKAGLPSMAAELLGLAQAEPERTLALCSNYVRLRQK